MKVRVSRPLTYNFSLTQPKFVYPLQEFGSSFPGTSGTSGFVGYVEVVAGAL
jgi:hypothetical protein